MKVDEIVLGQGGEFNLSSIPRQGERSFGFNGQVNSYQFRKNTVNDYQYYYALDRNDNVIAGIIGIYLIKNNTKYLQIKTAYVDKRYRRNHLAEHMYHSIKQIEHIQLMSDDTQTTEGRKLWKKISNTFQTKVMDLKTGQIVSDNPNDAYKNFTDFEIDNLVLVTETKLMQEGDIISPYFRIGKYKK
jgi:hypothetical protein